MKNQCSLVMPQTLIDIRNELLKGEFYFSKESLELKDGRTASTLQERELISYLNSKGFEKRIKESGKRDFCDIWLIDENRPVDIKITEDYTGAEASNAASWKSILYILNGVAKYDKNIQTTAAIKMITELLKSEEFLATPETYDYYYLQVTKPGGKTPVRISSIRSISNYKPSAQNDPYQVPWGQEPYIPTTYRDNSRLIEELLKPVAKKILQAPKLKAVEILLQTLNK